MRCPHCSSSSIGGRKRRTSLGYRTFGCRDCGRTFNERTAGSVRVQITNLQLTSRPPQFGSTLVTCPHCSSTNIGRRTRRTSLGYRIFACHDCGRSFNE